MGLALTPKEHPIDNKVMYWLHECNMDKAMPSSSECSSFLILWLSTVIENVFTKATDTDFLSSMRQLVSPEIVKRLVG